MANVNKSTKGASFKPGQSGNPKGRPRGVPDRRNEWRAALAEQLPELIEMLVVKAKAGDEFAIKLILDRVAPPLRAQSQTVDLVGMAEVKGLAAKAEAILDALAIGHMPIEAGRSLLESIGVVAKIAEVDDLARRVKALEQKRGDAQ